MNKRNEVSQYLENILLFLLGVLLLVFPLLFTNLTTDFFTLPKQIFLSAVVLIALLIWGAKMISEGSVQIRRGPFDLPVLIFAVVTLASSVLAVNQSDALIAFVPLLLAVLLYYLLTNVGRSESTISFLIYCAAIGATLVSVLAILSYAKIYLPFPFTHTRIFSPLGNLLDQTIYLAFVLPLCLYFAWPITHIKKLASIKIPQILFALASVIIAVGLGLSVFNLTTLKPQEGGLLVLPFENGFQIALSTISRDTGRVFETLSIGSGYGTFITDFTRFKEPVLNQNPVLWSLAFFRSSNLVFELLATTGILGFLAFLFLIIRFITTSIKSHGVKTARTNPVFFALAIAFFLSFFLPYSFVIQTMLFVLVALFSMVQGLHDQHHFYDVELQLVASKRGGIPFFSAPNMADSSYESPRSRTDHSFSKFLPVLLFVLFGIFAVLIGFNVYNFSAADILFQRSLVAAANNNALETYNNQRSAIQLFDKRDSFYRIFSDINLRLANSLASSQPQGSSPSAQTQQTIYSLIQQSINSARTATNVAPQTSLDWQNLAAVYRSLIGFGQNAENFAIFATQQAIALDPSNPQLYLNLGGIYYQLGRWEQAQNAFAQAVNLKIDFANAYYNLGHALEQKGDLPNALIQYQRVRDLVANDKNSQKQITKEIEALQAKLGTEGQGQAARQARNVAPAENPSPLELSTPSAKLPSQEPKVSIAPPGKISPTPTPSEKASPTPSL